MVFIEKLLITRTKVPVELALYVSSVTFLSLLSKNRRLKGGKKGKPNCELESR